MAEVFLPKQAHREAPTYERIVLKDNHLDYPFWVNYDGIIILETFSPLFKAATDFLIAISEPISRPKHIHEYKITSYSLYAAASVGLNTDDILFSLDRLSKNVIPKCIRKFIIACTLSYGKLKLILRESKYFIEILNEDVLKTVLKDSQISAALIQQEVVPADDMSENTTSLTYEIRPEHLECLKKRCIEIDFPLIEEYDFRNDKKLKEIDMELKNNIVIRTYQEISLNKMFGNGRGRSGIIVLPCGSGKTLVGITAICTIKKPTLVLCTSAVSVEQWKAQIKQFTNVKDDDIACFTSERKDVCDSVIVSTYTMLCFSGKRSYEAQKAMDHIKNTEWGLLILDEVHVVPAQMFRKVLGLVSHHCKLGLTATLLREDDKIEDLNFLIGPKLYEADWQYLSMQGHIATVSCFEVWCSMTNHFYSAYLRQNTRKRRVIAIMNPIKFQITQYLINMHEKRGDKIIVFSDNVHALKSYALKLGKPYIYGPTGQQERMKILKQFQTNPMINTLFLSKVGDTSIDLPEATCLIQISSHFGSRRQEAQRLGRILRAKRRNDPGFKVYFYSLVSKDTDEMYYSTKRQQYLIDQGYTFKVFDDMKMDNFDNRVFKTKEEQKELLASILLASEKELESEDVEETVVSQKSLKSVSNVEGVAYVEKKKKITRQIFGKKKH